MLKQDTIPTTPVNTSPMIPEIMETGPRSILEQGRLVIAVMGATGTGKSSFINIASGSHLEVGEDLHSCTTKIGVSKPFIVAGNEILLIDTPGFDDTLVEDADVWRMISFCMGSLFELGYRLSGVIYLHRISDHRMGGTSRKNLNVFRELCGDAALKNVTVATTMWNQVDMDVGTSRELELMSEEDFFRSFLEHGAQMRRHDGSKQSAWSIIEEVLQNCPRALRIQDELGVQKRDITETSVAREVGRELAELKRRQEKELLDLQEQLLQAKAISDSQTIEELEQVKADLEASVVKMEVSCADLPKRFNDEQRRLHQELYTLLGSGNAEFSRMLIAEDEKSEGRFDGNESFGRSEEPHGLSSTEDVVTVGAVANSTPTLDKNTGSPTFVPSPYNLPSSDHLVQHDRSPYIRTGMRKTANAMHACPSDVHPEKPATRTGSTIALPILIDHNPTPTYHSSTEPRDWCHQPTDVDSQWLQDGTFVDHERAWMTTLGPCRLEIEATLEKMQAEIDNLRHELARVHEAGPEVRVEVGKFERLGALLDTLVDHGLAERRRTRRRRGKKRT